MEQKQSLWIIAAVGVFLLVVIGAALILYSPAPKADSVAVTAAATPQQPVLPALSQTNAGDNTQGLQLQDFTALQQPSSSASSSSAATPVATVTAPDGTTFSVPVALLQTLNVSPQATVVQSQAESQASTQRVNELTVISERTNVIGTGATTFTGQQSASTEITNIQTVTPINNMAREVVGESAARPVTASVKTATPAKTVPVTPKTPVPEPVINQYWVQVAAFTTTEKTVAPMKSADTMRGALEENLVPVEVFTFTGSDGKLGYRVRVGPYETKSEAESAQAALRRMKNFENTQTFVVTVPKS